MNNQQPLSILPQDIQQNWMASLQRQVIQQAKGHFYLTAIRRTKTKTYEEQRIIVLVIDENGFPVPNVRVAFSYSTADQYILTPDFLWNPPSPNRAFTVPTAGSGQIDMILSGDGVVKSGQPGGVTVYILEPEYSSDVILGCGMLADHSGLHLTLQLRRLGVLTFQEQIKILSERITKLEG